MTLFSESLRQLLAREDILPLPGAPNALSARIATDLGFEAVYATGAGISNTFLAAPDLGMLTLTEIAAHAAAMRQVIDVPLIVDADTGFGNVVNVAHTVRVLERAGADAIQIEDQVFPKRCGHFEGKEVIDRGEMVGKIRSAVDARSDDMLVIARTDALTVLGLDEAISRGNAYREAGADVVFVEAPRSIEEMRVIGQEVPGPLLINIVEGGSTPALPPAELQAMGYSIVLYANLALLGMVRGVQEALSALSQGSAPTAIATWQERQRLVRLDDHRRLEQELGQR